MVTNRLAQDVQSRDGLTTSNSCFVVCSHTEASNLASVVNPCLVGSCGKTPAEYSQYSTSRLELVDRAYWAGTESYCLVSKCRMRFAISMASSPAL